MDLLTSAFRQLRAHAAFSTLIIALLALGIGANTAIFGVVDAALLKPLPYPAPGELVMVRKIPRDTATQIPGNGDLIPDNEFLAWIEAVPKSFRVLAGYRNSAATLSRGDSEGCLDAGGGVMSASARSAPGSPGASRSCLAPRESDQGLRAQRAHAGLRAKRVRIAARSSAVVIRSSSGKRNFSSRSW